MHKIQELLNSAGILWLRVLMGAGMIYHGYPKVFEGGASKITGLVAAWGWPFPAFFAWAAALSEFLGGSLILLGLATRPAAAMVLVTMLVAAFQVHAADPFRQKELALAYAVMAVTLILTGGGKFSLGTLVWPRVFQRKA